MRKALSLRNVPKRRCPCDSTLRPTVSAVPMRVAILTEHGWPAPVATVRVEVARLPVEENAISNTLSVGTVTVRVVSVPIVFSKVRSAECAQTRLPLPCAVRDLFGKVLSSSHSLGPLARTGGCEAPHVVCFARAGAVAAAPRLAISLPQGPSGVKKKNRPRSPTSARTFRPHKWVDPQRTRGLPNAHSVLGLRLSLQLRVYRGLQPVIFDVERIG